MNTARAVAVCCLAAAGWAGTGSILQQAPSRTATVMNPLEGSDKARLAGAKLFARECSACHGANREGGKKAPSLDRTDVRNAPPGALFWVLRNGSLNRGMPSFAHLPEPQRWQIITFLRWPGDSQQ